MPNTEHTPQNAVHLHDIFVTNKNTFFHSDRYNGQDYDFPPNQRVPIPVEAAIHMFGFNCPDKTEVLTRLGWAMRFNSKIKQYEDDPKGIQKLANFVFTRAVLTEELLPETAVMTEQRTEQNKTSELELCAD